MRSSERINRPNPVERKAREFATGLLLASTATLGSCADSEPIPKQETTTTTQQEITTTTRSPEDQKLQEQINESAISSALRVISLLERPDSGAEPYYGNWIGNKNSVIGKDGVFPSGDDNEAPETRVGLVENGTDKPYMQFISTLGREVGTPNASFHHISITLAVNPTNPILEVTRQLGLDDFKEAIENGQDVDVALFYAGTHGANDTGINANIVGDAEHPYSKDDITGREGLRYSDLVLSVIEE